jgi:flavin-dependent dehydrogenase
VLEKDAHPRFHIGESLLPANAALFDALGVREEVERLGLRKYGVEFVSPAHRHRGGIQFGDAWDKTMPYAWQVRRDVFDQMLFRHAARRGATMLEHHRVRHVAFDDDAATVTVEADGLPQTWRARYVIDASGRDTLLANQFDSKRRNPRHNSAALFGHFRNARRNAGQAEGNITIIWFQHGWFWVIPLADGSTSVGAVCWPYYLKTRNKPLLEFFRDTLAMSPGLTRRLKNAELIDDRVHATGNYSYLTTHCAGPRYALLGDAYAFIDPVFSSGVYLAMKSAFAVVPLVEATLDRPAEAARQRRQFERVVQHGPREFSWFIYRVTNPVMRELFMNPANPLRVKEALISLLAGDIYERTPIWGALRALKALYYGMSVMNLRRTVRAWRQRHVNIRDDAGATSS